jgi:hypothetical protein
VQLKARERLISDKAAALMMYQKQTQNHERSKQSAQVRFYGQGVAV